jgi:hypothetical protein
MTILTFEDWWASVEEDLEENCDNRMDAYDAQDWLRQCWDAATLSCIKATGADNNN